MNPGIGIYLILVFFLRPAFVGFVVRHFGRTGQSGTTDHARRLTGAGSDDATGGGGRVLQQRSRAGLSHWDCDHSGCHTLFVANNLGDSVPSIARLPAFDAMHLGLQEEREEIAEKGATKQHKDD